MDYVLEVAEAQNARYGHVALVREALAILGRNESVPSNMRERVRWAWEALAST